jgi:pimeloyl-ACP methyl ester carboxylesterase
MALLGIGFVLGISACGTATTLSTTTTSTTSTTLPSPVSVLATTPTGSASFEGPVYRIAVTPLANGATTLPSRPVSQRIVTGTVKIAYRQFGSGPNIVLAMGEHGTMTWWDPRFLQTLAQNYRVTIFDYPAVGYSAAMSRAPSVETEGDVMAGLIAANGLSNVTVLGWGVGGEAALSLVERHPGIAVGLVLVDSASGGSSATRPLLDTSTVFGTPTSTMAQLATEMFPATAAGESAQATWLTDIATVEPDDVVSSAVTDQAGAQNAFFRDNRVSRLLSTVSLPTLIFQGARDTLFREQNAHLLQQSLKGSKLVIDPTGGYAALFQDRSIFLNQLSSFMTKISSVTTTTTVP